MASSMMVLASVCGPQPENRPEQAVASKTAPVRLAMVDVGLFVVLSNIIFSFPINTEVS
jgi:hypothetical protein